MTNGKEIKVSSDTPRGGRRQITDGPEETRTLGRRIGELAAPGTVLALTGDLGSGKTVLVQGLARGLKVPPGYYVTSPTYTLINEYPGRCRLYHVDLYRLDGAGAGDEIGLDEVLHGGGVVALEWAERLAAGTFGDHLAVDIRTVAENRREIILQARGPRSHEILEALAPVPGSEVPPPAEERK